MNEFYKGFMKIWETFAFSPEVAGTFVGLVSLMIAPVVAVVVIVAIVSPCISFVRKRFTLRRDRPATRPRGR